jgi:hypothetical protein
MQTDLQGPAPEDPLVKVKEQEIQARAAADAAKDQNEKQRIQLEGVRVQGDLMVDQAKIALDELKLQQQGTKDATQANQNAQNARIQAISRAQKGGNPSRQT